MSNQLPVFVGTAITDENFDPCKGCPIVDADWYSDIRCTKSAIVRYDLEDAVAADDDPIELMVVADPPTEQDEGRGGFFSDDDATEILGYLKKSGAKSFVVVPAVRCFPGEQVDHFILKKKYRNERKQDGDTGLDVAMDAVEYCKQYVVRTRFNLRPKRVLAMGAIATKAVFGDANVLKLRSTPIHPNPGLRAASKSEGTIVTWDRAYARVSTWASGEIDSDITEKLPNLATTGFATPRGDHNTIEQVTLDTVEQVEKFVNHCLTSNFDPGDMLCFDFEADNLDLSAETNRLLNVGFTFRSNENLSWIVPFAHPETPFSVDDLVEVFALMRKLFMGVGAKWHGYVAHSAQYEVAMVKLFFGVWLGEAGKKKIYDTLLLAYTNDENRHKKGIKTPYGLETLAREYLGFRWYAETGIKTRRDRLSSEPLVKVNEYVGMDSAVTARLLNWLMESMEDEGSLTDLMRLAAYLYSDAILYTVDLQLTGQAMDIDLLRLLRGPDSSIGPRLDELRKLFRDDMRCKKAVIIANQNRYKQDKSKKAKGKGKAKHQPAGRPKFNIPANRKALEFDLNSDLHRKALFWDVMRLTGAKDSVDKKFQERHCDREPLVALFMEYQGLSTLNGLFLTPIAEYLQKTGDGRLHPYFNLSKTTSGRLSASEPNCYDEETEALTPHGWVPFPELTEDDEVAQWHPDSDTIDFVDPDDISIQSYAGEMVSIQNDHIDLVVTPNHRCPLTSKAGMFKEFMAAEYPSGAESYKQLQASRWEGGYRSYSEAEIALICAAQAEGSWRTDVKQGAMEWTFHKERKIERLRWALDQTHGVFSDSPNGEKGTRFYAPFSPAVSLIKATIGSDKALRPEWITSLDRETLDLFVAEINFWDGCFTGNNQYTSIVKQNTDAVQIALVLSGTRATVNESKGYNAWAIHQTNTRPYSWTTNMEPKRVRSTGEVYCVTVPTGYVMVRRNGKVSICGQTQQVPRGDTKDKKQIKSLYTVPPGKVMVQLDFSQAEVRWLGILSGDENLAQRYIVAKELKDALRADPDNPELQKKVKIDGDLHMSTALDMYKLDRDLPFTDPEKAALKRQNAKAVCFGLIYGKNYRSLATDLGISDEEALGAVDKWLAQFPEAAAWLKNVDETIRDTCVSRSPFGRWRRLPEARADDISVQNRAKRQARNTPVQSAASDFCIYAACKLRRALMRHTDPDVRSIKLINTVHDSIAAEVPADPKVLETYMTIAKSIFTDPKLIKKNFKVEATVPLEVDFDIGLNWGNVEGCELNSEDIKRVLFNTEVLRSMPAGTLLKDLSGKGKLYGEVDD